MSLNISPPFEIFILDNPNCSCTQQKTKGNKTSVVSAKQMSKKKARKLLKAMRRNEQSIRKLENKMDFQ